VKVGFGSGLPLHKADLKLGRRALDIGRHSRRGRVGRIGEDEQPPKGHHFAEDLNALVLKFPYVIRDAGQVAAGPRHALHEAGSNRIAHMGEYHWDL
jgi:hypothetical protein